MESDFQPQLQHISAGLQLQRHNFCCWVIGCHFIAELPKDFVFLWLYPESWEFHQVKVFTDKNTPLFLILIPFTLQSYSLISQQFNCHMKLWLTIWFYSIYGKLWCILNAQDSIVLGVVPTFQPMGCAYLGLGEGYPTWPWPGRYHPPAMVVTPVQGRYPPPPQETEQHSENCLSGWKKN